MDENQNTDPATNPDSPINLEVKHKGIRFRYLFMGFFGALALLLLFVTDPDSKLITALPIAAGFVATIVLLVTIYFHWILKSQGYDGSEKSILWVAMTFLIFVRGAGAWSVDRFMKKVF